MYEMPPILKGTERQQIAALRDYLVRMARQDGQSTDKVVAQITKSVTGASDQEAADLKENAAQLRQLIVKTADNVRVVVERVDTIQEDLHSDYLAVSDFADFVETIDTRITETARGVVEEYDYNELIRQITEREDEFNTYLTNIRGEIRRGLITDPETGETAMGIAISERLSFTGQEQTVDGLVYYELSPGQTLGLYTATGWQFWINGSKRGWFDSRDSMLHVTNIVSENSFKLSDKWEITNSDGFGIKYVGS